MKAIKTFTVLMLFILAFSFLCGCGTNKENNEDVQTTEIVCPWDEKGAKQPSEYTWEEFEALSGDQQIVFQNSFKSIDDFEKWMDESQSEKTVYPWDEEGAKQPKDYTWEEFEALSANNQIAFQKSFDKTKDFDKWLEANQP